MAETADYDPGPWSGYDFKTSRATYDAHAGRSYGDAISKGITSTSLVPDSIETTSDAPLVIACDVTGSMGDWPATIFSKLPYLDKEGKEYLGENMEISFAAIGDIFSDRYPLQVQPFVKGLQLEESLKKLIIEGGGGGSSEESYDIAALYYANNVKMPNAIKPIFIFIGDEGIHTATRSGDGERHAKVLLENLNLSSIMEQLQSKYSVYIVRKPYHNDNNAPRERAIREQWESLLGADHVCSLPDASRVVDVIFGILARETGKIDYFKTEIEDRQESDKVSVVMKSLATIHKLDNPSKKKLAKPQASITKRKGNDPGGGAVSIPLLED